MANIKQQKKRDITNNKSKLRNNSFKSSLKTAIKAVEAAVEAKDLAKAEASLVTAYAKLDKALAKGFVHKNNVARNKSRLAKLVNSIR
ncbi:MAG: 30S ribosomal protein S20 [Bacilli bacterium]|nr:30S ribosomal protein S20 [Bacilli bacterium]MBP5550956.1 30S ribosomal protein S20 [Bacilli bacterium]